MVGGGDHLADDGPGHCAADGHVQVGRQPSLRFDRAEVLRVITEDAAQVLNEPVHQRGEVQRVPGRPPVVVGARIDGRAVAADLAVAVAGEGEEHRRPVAPA